MGIDLTGIGAAADAIKGIADKIWPDKTQAERDAAALNMAQLLGDQNLTLAQIETNKVEAASTNWFVAGWRPMVGWVGACGLAYASIVEPLMRFAAVQWGYTGTFPAIDTSITLQVLFGLLGLGSLRTVEKIQDVHGKH